MNPTLLFMKNTHRKNPFGGIAIPLHCRFSKNNRMERYVGRHHDYRPRAQVQAYVNALRAAFGMKPRFADTPCYAPLSSVWEEAK